MREVLERRPETRPRYQSAFERRLFDLLAAAALPLPIPQYSVDLPDGSTAVLDFAYPTERLGLEADSYVHPSSRRDWERDHTRNRLLTALGWRILPVVWEDMTTRAVQLVELVNTALVPTERFELSLTTT